jgi:hypothetical protein
VGCGGDDTALRGVSVGADPIVAAAVALRALDAARRSADVAGICEAIVRRVGETVGAGVVRRRRRRAVGVAQPLALLVRERPPRALLPTNTSSDHRGYKRLKSDRNTPG